jgi:hypothetical protein
MSIAKRFGENFENLGEKLQFSIGRRDLDYINLRLAIDPVPLMGFLDNIKS